MITTTQLVEIVQAHGYADYDAATVEGLIEDAVLELNGDDGGMDTIIKSGDEYTDDAGMWITSYLEEQIHPDPQKVAVDAEEAELAEMDQRADLKRMAENYRRTHQWDLNALEYLRVAMREAAPTMSESEIARVAGVTRMTVRKALGK